MDRIKVPSDGPLNAKIFIVGEAPGETEVRRLRPFVGPAGELLDKCLQQASIARKDCRVENVIPYRPVNNDVTEFVDLEKNFFSRTYYEGVEELKHNIEQSTATTIVALGNVALYALTGEKGITKWRGSVLECKLVPGKKVVPVIHPSAALRMYLWQRLIIWDLQKAYIQSGFDGIIAHNLAIAIDPSYEATIAYLEDIKKNCRMCACDIETVGGSIRCISFAPSPNMAISIPFWKQGKYNFTLEQEKEIWLLIGAILEDPTIVKIFQNGVFDCTFIYTLYGIVTRNVEDTMVAQNILMPDYEKGLAFITSIYTNYPYYKDDGKIWKLKNPTLEEEQKFWHYNAMDSIICAEAWPLQEGLLRQRDNYETYKRQMSLYHPLIFIQYRGIKVDIEGLQKARIEANKQIEANLKLLHEYDSSLNPKSPKQLQMYFYGKLGHNPYLKQGKITTDVDAMKRLARKGVKEASIVLEFRHWEKLRSTYFDMPLDADNRFRGSMNISGTATGRISSSQTIFGTGGNMTNQPPEAERYYIADEGYIIYNIDLSQAENRIVAYISPEPAMINAFERGVDVHSLTGALISGLPIETIIEQHKAYERALIMHEDPSPYCCPLGDGGSTWRFWAKKANHALNYGMGYKRFSMQYELPEKEGKQVVEAYHRAYPGIRQGYHSWIKAQLYKDRTLVNLYGRRRVFLDRWGDELFNDAFSHIPQSSVADKMWKEGIVPIYEKYPEVILLNCVHDSVKFMIPLTLPLDEHVRILRSIITELETPCRWRSYEFVIPCDLSVGFNCKELTSVNHRQTDDTVKARIQQVIDDYYRT